MSSLRATRRVTFGFSARERLSSWWRSPRTAGASTQSTSLPISRWCVLARRRRRRLARSVVIAAIRAQVVSAGEDTYVNIWSLPDFDSKGSSEVWRAPDLAV